MMFFAFDMNPANFIEPHFPWYFKMYKNQNPPKIPIFSQKIHENPFSGQISLLKGEFYSLLIPDFTAEHGLFYHEKK